ncbi:MAG: hypothetical protein V4726_19545 [Verrucomicrobiota bacterium]
MPPADPPPSKVLLEECYSEGDSRFPELLRRVGDPKTLEAFVNRWLADPRPWARERMLRYLEFPFDRNGHAVVVKRLFKHAEKSGDDALMGAFMVAFDRLVRRVRKKEHRWDQAARAVYVEEVLKSPLNQFRGGRHYHSPKTGKWEFTGSYPDRRGDRLFSYRSRYYLRRRVWRYFRLLAWREPARYVAAVSAALARYGDSDFQKGENLLDSWSFMHACFGESEALKFQSHRTLPAEGKTLADLSPAPFFPEHWRNAAGLSALARLAAEAPARTVRIWAVRLMASPDMASAGVLDFADLKRLLFSPDEDVQPQAVTLLERHPDTGRWTVPQWLALLDAPGHAALEAVTTLMKRHVRPDRLDTAQCVGLACVRPFSVARMGCDFLKERELSAAEILEFVPKTAAARCAALAAELTVWSLDALDTIAQRCRISASLEFDHAAARLRLDTKGLQPYDERYLERISLENLSLYFDSALAATRLAAWEWLGRHQDTPAWNDPVFWSRLAETPYEDLRLKLVDTLAVRAALPARDGRSGHDGWHGPDLAPVWTAVLLGVHRGGRQKRKAMRQMVAAIAGDESLSTSLLPVLAVAVRSLRGPERRAGLAAVVELAGRSCALDEAVGRLLPELRFLTPPLSGAFPETVAIRPAAAP